MQCPLGPSRASGICSPGSLAMVVYCGSHGRPAQGCHQSGEPTVLFPRPGRSLPHQPAPCCSPQAGCRDRVRPSPLLWLLGPGAVLLGCEHSLWNEDPHGAPRTLTPAEPTRASWAVISPGSRPAPPREAHSGEGWGPWVLGVTWPLFCESRSATWGHRLLLSLHPVHLNLPIAPPWGLVCITLPHAAPRSLRGVKVFKRASGSGCLSRDPSSAATRWPWLWASYLIPVPPLPVAEWRPGSHTHGGVGDSRPWTPGSVGAKSPRGRQTGAAVGPGHCGARRPRAGRTGRRTWPPSLGKEPGQQPAHRPRPPPAARRQVAWFKVGRGRGCTGAGGSGKRGSAPAARGAAQAPPPSHKAAASHLCTCLLS
ncbi:uncharacterized protein LOC125087611 isoform X1 [Lutra lutra]|uniref:uncharacterized protein LOC125087611 isoform X1 n=1 Tax=Lutra lutra TaxID=9657 RepID=UPI001FD3EF00|nr:uncharacterized protein LOC125087611 isoform X1 [Lutra lutra]XP_047564047.1 uncharacterized protein LOC125087611 isoform X1 [Lutra lutra]